MSGNKPSNFARYGLAIALTLTVLGIRMAFAPLLSANAPFIFFYPAVFISALYGGFGPGLTAALSGGLMAIFFILRPEYSLAVERTSDLAGLLLYLGNSLLVSWMGGSRLRTGRALRASRDLFASAFEASPLALTITSLRTGRLLEVNETFVRLAGYTRDEAVGRTTLELGLWANPSDRTAELAQVTAQHRVRNQEYRFRMKDGKELIGLLSAEQIEIDGEPCALTLIEDITERKRAEDALRESEARLSALLEQLPVGVGLTDAAGHWILSNPVLRRFVGDVIPSRDSRTGVRWRAWDSDGQPIEKSQWPGARALRGETVEGMDFLFTSGTGQEVWTRVSSAPFRNAAGEIIGALIVIQDIDTRKRAEAQLRERAEEIAALMEAVPAVVFITRDPDAQVITGSRTAREILRMSPGENLSKTAPAGKAPVHFRIFRNGVEVPPEELPVQLAARGIEIHDYEEEIRFENGDSVWLFGNAVPLRDEDGNARGAVSAFVDITERKRAEKEREELLAREQAARAAAEAATRTKDEFLAVVSHELRSPLSSILGYTRLARAHATDAATVIHHCNIIERSAKMQQQLIEDLLDTARIITGKLKIEAAPADLRLVLEEALSVVQPAAEAKRIELIARLGDEPLEIIGDAARLQQVVWNLLQNAIKFTPEGGRVELRLERSDRQARVIVSDSGKGIEPEFLATIFDRFSQNDMSRTRRHGGLGLGLALARQLVELHSGTIEASSDGVGQGATFTVTLPLYVPQPAVSQPPRAGAEVRTGQEAIPLDGLPRLDGVRVLLVEDQEETRFLVTNALAEWGATVTTAASGPEARARLQDHRFDVLVCDIAMPDEDGYEVIEKVREIENERGEAGPQRLPAIALTAMARSEDRLQALAAGFQTHVAKPVEIAELVMVIHSLTRSRQQGTAMN
ncbi:MAG TPA: PAS domain S-box protein [Blastocatellia bacterium]|nr:PAS domain S-box protein [Blastocatellia bacterium]